MSFTVNIKNTTPIVTKQDINRKFMYRYFASKANQVNTTVYEITRRDYEKYLDNPFVVLGHLKWVIDGKLKDTKMDVYTGNSKNDRGIESIVIPGVLTQNKASVMFLSKKIPAIKNLLRRYDQFYIGDRESQMEEPVLVGTPEPPTGGASSTSSESVPESPSVPTWTNIALDTFTDTNGVAVESHTPDSGFTGWVQPTSGGTIQIQGNRARQTTAPFGGRRHFVTTSDIVYDNFKFYADLFPSTTVGAGEIGIVFRNNGGYTNSTVAGNNIDGIELATAAVPVGTGESTTVLLALRAHQNGVQGTNFWSESAVNIPNFVTAGARFEVTVSGDQVDVIIRPAGGGTAYFTQEGITIPSPVFNDSGHAKFGLRYGGGTHAREYDNFTVQTLI